MKKSTLFTIFLLIFFISCKRGGKNQSESTDNEAVTSSISHDFFFKFTIDGKEVSIPIEEVSSNYNSALKKPVFKIMAGVYGKINLMLVTTADLAKPS